jgi:hypothetical protein
MFSTYWCVPESRITRSWVMGQFRTVRYDGEENLASRSGAGQAVPRPRSGRVRGSADVAANPRNAVEVYQFIQDFSNAGGNFGQSLERTLISSMEFASVHIFMLPQPPESLLRNDSRPLDSRGHAIGSLSQSC